MEKILFKNIQNYPEYSGTISEYEITGGYRTAAKILKTVQPNEIIEEVKTSVNEPPLIKKEVTP